MRSVIASTDRGDQYDLLKVELARLVDNPLLGTSSGARALLPVMEEARLLLQKLEHMALLKASVARLNQRAIAEIKSFAKPMQEIEDTMRATFLLLGEEISSLKTWKDVKKFIGKTGKLSLKRRIAEFVLANLGDGQQASVLEARRLISQVHVARMREISLGTAAFYGWSKGVLDELEGAI